VRGIWPGVAAAVALWLPAVPARAGVLIVVEPGIEAYSEALDGVTAVLQPGSFRVHELRSGAPGLQEALGARDVQAVVAIGSRAVSEVNGRRPDIPLVAAMTLLGRAPDDTPGVHIDVPLGTQLKLMRSLWPRRVRVGLVRNPLRCRHTAEALESQARKEGYTPIVRECDGPAKLMKTLADFRGRADFLLCFPDQDLYNPMTIQPLVLAAIEQRLPIIGFSAAFVRAGAAAGIFPDYREIGRQSGEMVLRRLAGDERRSEDPRTVRVAVNQRILRLLGVDFLAESIRAEVFR